MPYLLWSVAATYLNFEKCCRFFSLFPQFDSVSCCSHSSDVLIRLLNTIYLSKVHALGLLVHVTVVPIKVEIKHPRYAMFRGCCCVQHTHFWKINPCHLTGVPWRFDNDIQWGIYCQGTKIDACITYLCASDRRSQLQFTYVVQNPKLKRYRLVSSIWMLSIVQNFKWSNVENQW